jgi:hypothetical protein
MDFSEFETARGGIWRICAVIDDATKYCLAATVTRTSRGQDALGCLRRAVVEVERVLETRPDPRSGALRIRHLTCDGPDRLRRAWLG